MQFSPSNKIYAQALEKLRALARSYSTSKTRDADQIAAEISTTLKEIADQANGPTVEYREIEYGENPSSFRMNQFLQSLAFDINVILDEMNITKAASVDTHNLIKTELLKAEAENSRLHNKIKTLQLYSGSEDSSILYVGDHFYNDDYVDWSRVPITDRVELIKGDEITLGITEELQLLGDDSKLKVESGSNGFMGNNQEAYRLPIPVIDTPVERVRTGGGYTVIIDDFGNEEDLDIDINDSPIYFMREGYEEPASVQLNKVVDQAPNTVFEFEKYFISEANRDQAENYNFQYQYVDREEYKYLEDLSNEEGELFWANSTDELVLNLSIDIGSIKKVNRINFTPFGLTDNKNTPILIKKVLVSKDKNDWFVLEPQNLWVANGIDQNTVNLAGENIVINNAMYRVDGESVRYIRFEMLQPVPIEAKIGHFYYVDSEEEDPDATPKRLEGPTPTVDRIWAEKNPNASYQNNLVQKRELIEGKRWAIGIRDIGAYSTQYRENSTMVSKKFYAPGGIDRVALEADIYLPEGFAVDVAWVRFYVSPDDGNTWTQISRIQDDFLGLPEVIAFNDNTPVELRLPGVHYVETDFTATSVRVKIEIDRPAEDNTVTPVVKSYRLKIKQRTTL